MSQTAESARDWINSAEPSLEKLQNTAAAIERKLQDHPSLDDETRQNLAGALQEVSTELQALQYAAEDADDSGFLSTSNSGETTIDVSALGNKPASGNIETDDLGEKGDPAIHPLSGDAKAAAFAALKKKLSQ